LAGEKETLVSRQYECRCVASHSDQSFTKFINVTFESSPLSRSTTSPPIADTQQRSKYGEDGWLKR